MKTIIDSAEWQEFLSDFSNRNRGRRARFEIFDRGSSAEEQQEGHFESASIDGRVVTITRTYESQGEKRSMNDELHDIHGIEIQLDADGSENTIEFSNHNGDMTVLHFESMVDGDS